ncbi:DUF4878 domain-containing protein [Heyndrickxia acidicola]|uniref:DUF4878 domain-containing protein n=1 Tax=Heyndrickxia acidicola TaxID=209389 RepID=A0ABU6MLN3_9BACI|nr:DUF4878 domain-containing protein [Heyndrickxia acidicola]MED1205600.1 DUF4878 domain-containing protein [Heyndrickxia acidicola]
MNLNIMKNMGKKKLILIVLGFAIALSLIVTLSIHSESTKKTPSQVITAFVDAAKHDQIKESKKYVSKDILDAFEHGGFAYYGSYGGFITDYASKTKSVQLLSNTQKIKGQSATIDANVIDNYGEKEKTTFYLIKEDGEWKIAK